MTNQPAVTVPREPTDAMIDAYCEKIESLGFTKWANLSTLWPVILAAAPEAPPVHHGEEVERVARIMADHFGSGFDAALSGKREWIARRGVGYSGETVDVNGPFKPDYLDAAKLILSTIRPAEGWRPIETAPKDGTPVLLWCPDGIDRLYASPENAKHYCIGFRGDSGGMYANDGWWSVESREEIGGYGSEMTGPMSETECLRVNPSHWRPLPPPPEQEGGRADE